MAVSITNNCSYCTHSHTATAKKLGMTQEEHSEFLSIVALAAKTNQLVNGLEKIYWNCLIKYFCACSKFFPVRLS